METHRWTDREGPKDGEEQRVAESERETGPIDRQKQRDGHTKREIERVRDIERVRERHFDGLDRENQREGGGQAEDLQISVYDKRSHFAGR